MELCRAFDLARDVTLLTGYCEDLFASLPRADQRRWGEAYVRGLICVPGRKSIRRISDLVVGRDADQSLQQFVNQSPWDWGPVRRALAEDLGQVLRPQVWTVREVVFPKNGGNSVGVARQYAPPAGRVLNCQRAVGVFLAGAEGSGPVNWRLVLPRQWDEDVQRRLKSRVPEEERSRPVWQYVLEAIDEMLVEWGLPAAPIQVDLSNERDIRPLLEGLDERGLGYLARVPMTTPVTLLEPVEPAGPAGPITAGRLVELAARRGRATISWPDEATGQPTGTQFVLASVRGAMPWGRALPGTAFTRSHRVLAEWPWRMARPRSVWLTNIATTRVVDLVGLLRAGARTGADSERLASEFGLRHFEGRSFQGWHHHVTLVSIAHAFTLVSRLEGERLAGRALRPVSGRL